MPHWANRYKQPAHCCCLEWQCLELNAQPFELQSDMLTTTRPGHNQGMINIPQCWQMAYQNHRLTSSYQVIPKVSSSLLRSSPHPLPQKPSSKQFSHGAPSFAAPHLGTSCLLTLWAAILLPLLNLNSKRFHVVKLLTILIMQTIPSRFTHGH